MDLEILNKIARTAALEAGAIARQKFADPGPIHDKGFRDVITEVDLAAQACITGIIRKAYPDHAFLTEEEDGDLPKEGPVVWIVDPLDGTINYSRKIPLYCVSIAAAINNKPLTEDDLLVGVIYDPVRDELFSAVRGQPSLLNNEEITSSSIAVFNEADIGHDWHRYPDIRESTQAVINRLLHEVKSIRALNTAALAMAWVAAGRLDAYFNFGVHAWDIAAASLLVRQAGGGTMILGEEKVLIDQDFIPFLVSNSPIYEKLLEKFR